MRSRWTWKVAVRQRPQPRRAVLPFPAQPQAQHAETLVAQSDEVLGELALGAAVVDADPVHTVQARGLVADHGGDGPGQHRVEVRVVGGHGVDDEPVHPGAEHHPGGLGGVPAGVGGHEQQTLAGRLAGLGEPGQETDRARIAEGVRQRLGEQQPDRAGLAGPQRAGHRIGPRVTQARGLAQHPLAQRRGELVGPVVGVGDGGPRHLERRGEGGEGRLPARSARRVHPSTLTGARHRTAVPSTAASAQIRERVPRRGHTHPREPR